MNGAFVMTWRDASGALRMQPLAARTLAAAWDVAFGVAESLGWDAACSFGIGRAGARA